MENKILYLCNRKKCENCSYPTCKHTTDIDYAVSFEKNEAGCYEEQKQAKWIDDAETAHCSNCGSSLLYMPCKNKLAVPTYTPYCYHCGCKMSYPDDILECMDCEQGEQ